MSVNFETIDETEIEDFINECTARGFNPEEFSLIELDVLETEITVGTSIINGKVTITRGEVSKTYMTGDSADWLLGFSRDLRNGVWD